MGYILSKVLGKGRKLLFSKCRSIIITIANHPSIHPSIAGRTNHICFCG